MNNPYFYSYQLILLNLIRQTLYSFIPLWERKEKKLKELFLQAVGHLIDFSQFLTWPAQLRRRMPSDPAIVRLWQVVGCPGTDPREVDPLPHGFSTWTFP